jgi:hypothetical protein
VSALGVLVTQPLDRFFELNGGLPFSQHHLAGVTFDADIERPQPMARSCKRTKRSTIGCIESMSPYAPGT